MEWFIKVIKNFSFKGRARRKEYWMFMLVFTVVLFGLTFIDDAVGTQSKITPIGLFIGVFTLAFLIQYLAVGIRRLHDTGRSAWWFLINFVPFVGPVIWLLLMLLEGQQGENNYGPDPKQSTFPERTTV